jgi:uncharacterized membrane protein
MTPLARAFRRHDPRQAGMRLLLATAVGAAIWFAVPERAGLTVRALAAWVAAGGVMTVLGWLIILRASATRTRSAAASDDPGRTVVWLLVLGASTASLLAVGRVLRRAHLVTPTARDLLAVLCVASVAVAWLLTHTAYALRYAHLYYRDDEEGEGGLTFPGTPTPAYFDFAYFSFTIGMTFQVSDVVITSSQIRRAALSHAILSFFYTTVILAVALNLVLGVLG